MKQKPVKDNMNQSHSAVEAEAEQSGGFLSRWSSRKLQAEQSDESELSSYEGDIDEQDVIETTANAEQELTEAEPEPVSSILTDEDMPDVDSLTEDSDFSVFMSSGVSQELRKKALRKLFSSAVFNVRDGLDDYDDDFTTFEPMGDMITCDMKHQIEVAEEKAKRAAAELLEAEPEQLVTDDRGAETTDTLENADENGSEIQPSQETEEDESIEDSLFKGTIDETISAETNNQLNTQINKQITSK